MSTKGCAPDDVFDKYCAELSVPRLITTWSIEMSKQQLIDTLSNRGYRFDLIQSSVDQLLQLLRESDVLYHQVKKDVSVSNRESITTATARSEKSNEPKQSAQQLDSGTSGIQVLPGIDFNLPRVHSKQPVEDVGAAAREGAHTSQGDLGRQILGENSLAKSSGREEWGERQQEAEGGKRKSEPDDEEQVENAIGHERKKKTLIGKIEFKQRVDDVQSRLSALARKVRLETSVIRKIDRLRGNNFSKVKAMVT
ncbi:hypothetical protein KC342_g6544 [Hortaea werneckii]|nr:hypothetical protein KC342_g6544 [Hortaea werneckii]